MGEIYKAGTGKRTPGTDCLGRGYFGLASKTVILFAISVSSILADSPLQAIPLPKDVDTAIAGTVDFEGSITRGVTALVTQVEPSLLHLGFVLLGIFGCIAFLQSLLKSQLTLLSSHHFMPQATFVACVAIMFRICIADIMLSYYAVPMWAGGWNFHQIFPEIAAAMSNSVTSDSFTTVLATFNNVMHYLPTPGMFTVLPALIAVILIITIVVAQIAMVIITCSSYAIQGVLVLVGPIMIPFYVLPNHDKRFWKWMDNLLVYSMYQFVGSCFINVFMGAYVNFFTNLPGFSVAQWLISLPMLILITIVFAFVMFKVPDITHMIFGGMGDVSGFASALQGLVVKGVSGLL